MTARMAFLAACAGLFLGCAARAVAPEGALLRYRYRAGQVITYRVTMDVHARIGSASAPAGPSATARTGTTRMRVLSVTRDGTARIRAVQTTALAGKQPGPATTLTYTVSPLGQVRDVQAPGRQAPQLLGAALDPDALGLMQAPLPTGRVRQGATWTARLPSPFRGARPLAARARLVRLTAGRSARIQLAYTVPVDITVHQAGQPVRVRGSIAMRGVTELNLASGVMASSSTNGAGTLRVAFASGDASEAQPPSVRLTVKTTMRRM